MAVGINEVLEGVDNGRVYGVLPSEVLSVVSDSRQVTPGACFVAIPGVSVDGHLYIPDALARGATLIVGEREPDPTWLKNAAYLRVPNARVALAYLAAAYYGHPSRALLVVGVTGTDGKTTTSILIASILQAAGYSTGFITTTGARIGERDLDTGFHVTTPDAPDVQRYLREMVDARMDAVVLESTSHGLDQRRVDAVAFDVAVMTNVTHEHLDYHGTWERYMAAKARLFTLTAEAPRKPGVPRVAVLNRDDRSYNYLRSVQVDRVLTYGRSPDAHVRLLDARMGVDHMSVALHSPLGKMTVETSLVGEFNVYNVLAAVAVGLGLGLPPEALREGVRAVTGVPGRLERIAEGQDFLALVDFAHTPMALQQALHTLRQMSRGRLIAVYGSAGRRDVAKRYLMGKIGAERADVVILTAEDPRTESLDAILAAMARGAREGGGVEGETFWRVPDRQEAILRAVMMAEPGDVVAVFGKGHERSMCFGEVEYPWRDQEALRWALRVRLYGRKVAGPPPFALPTA